MKGGCDEQFCSERKEGYIYQKPHWRLPLVTACGNLFPEAVVIIQPSVKMLHLHWRLPYDNRLWKSISTGGYKVVAHLFLYTAGPKVKPPVKKEDHRLRALFY
jgi:hypothetical protein